jgi:hypothetical protein
MNDHDSTATSTELALHAIEVALEAAQSCISGQTPEEGSDKEAREWTLGAIRGALFVHLPTVRSRVRQ